MCKHNTRARFTSHSCHDLPGAYLKFACKYPPQLHCVSTHKQGDIYHNCTCLYSQRVRCKVSKTYWCISLIVVNARWWQPTVCFDFPQVSGRHTGYTSATEHIRHYVMHTLLNHTSLNARTCQQIPVIDWISDTRSQGCICTDLQNLVICHVNRYRLSSTKEVAIIGVGCLL